MVSDNKIYHECMQLTSQFRFCPNAFRVDMYRGCDFGCRYCFANMEAFKEVGTGLSTWREARITDVKHKFELAFDTDKESKSVIVELLRNRVPIHCGGMSDPFQSREWSLHLTLELIKLSVKYHYPIIFSTKTNYLPDEYFDYLDPSIHAFQVSISGLNDDYIRTWESNTPTTYERIKFVKELRDRGYWCGVRIQPIIDIDECEKLMHCLKDIPSYYSTEHLHVIMDSHIAKATLLNHCNNPEDFTHENGILEFKHSVKIKNQNRLITVANKYGVKVGVADNDLHFMSQSRCCCGVDLIGEEFNNYLKFNTCYLSTGDSDISNMFIPKSNCRRHMNIGKGKPVVLVEDVVRNYIIQNPQLIPDIYREDIERQLFGKTQNRLF